MDVRRWREAPTRRSQKEEEETGAVRDRLGRDVRSIEADKRGRVPQERRKGRGSAGVERVAISTPKATGRE